MSIEIDAYDVLIDWEIANRTNNGFRLNQVLQNLLKRIEQLEKEKENGNSNGKK